MKLRATNLRRLDGGQFDVLIVGGGINGAVSAAALAARGVKVALIDRGDFAGETSQHSSNLAWGGIKYLETFEFALVRKLCIARNRLLREYPSTVQEIRFLTTLERGFRHSRLKLLAGAWLYWMIGNGFTKTPRLLSNDDIADDEQIVNLDKAVGGFEYSDAYLQDNDARFVFNFVRSALSYGCAAVNYLEAVTGEQAADGWKVKLRDSVHGTTHQVTARVVVNAAGPWADPFNQQLGQTTQHHHAFSKGIHIIVPRLTNNRRVLTFFADDGRLFFVIPMGPRTCIGTTDTRVERPEVEVTEADRKFVFDNINKRLRLEKPLSNADIIAERCGVRPLVVKGGGSGERDWLQMSRKHVVEVDQTKRFITIFGGKLTDCLNVGDEITDIIGKMDIVIPFPKQRWYGEPPDEIRDEYFHQARLMNLDAMTAPGASEPLSTRLWRRYGAQAIGLLENIRSDPRMAEVMIEHSEYTRCEIEQAARREMITKLDDFMRRRSKISLVVDPHKLRDAPGLKEACRILFGAEADKKLEEYFADLAPEPELTKSEAGPDTSAA